MLSLKSASMCSHYVYVYVYVYVCFDITDIPIKVHHAMNSLWVFYLIGVYWHRAWDGVSSPAEAQVPCSVNCSEPQRVHVAVNYYSCRKDHIPICIRYPNMSCTRNWCLGSRAQCRKPHYLVNTYMHACMYWILSSLTCRKYTIESCNLPPPPRLRTSIGQNSYGSKAKVKLCHWLNTSYFVKVTHYTVFSSACRL